MFHFGVARRADTMGESVRGPSKKVKGVRSSWLNSTLRCPGTITTQPLTQTVTQGLNATFSIVASGTAPFSYQWRYGGAALPGATNTTLVVTNVQYGQAGNYGGTVTDRKSKRLNSSHL